MSADAPASEAYDVSRTQLLELIKCDTVTLWRHQRAGLIPPGRKRSGVRGKFYTEAQANKLLRLLGRKERIHIED